MKKILFMAIAMSLTFSLVAEGSGSVNVNPIGYMNHSIITTHDSNTLAQELGDQFKIAIGSGTLQIGDQRSTNVYNAYALGLDVNYSFFYASLSLGLPAKLYSDGFDPILLKWPTAFTNSDRIGGTIILDGQIGGGVDLMQYLNKNGPLSVFVGGGVAVNYVRVKRPIAENSSLINALTGVKSMTEFRNIVQAGLGLRAGVTYNILPSVGVNLTLTDSLHFIKLYMQRIYEGRDTTGISYKYFLTKDGNENKSTKKQFANNFVIRLGVGIKF